MSKFDASLSGSKISLTEEVLASRAAAAEQNVRNKTLQVDNYTAVKRAEQYQNNVAMVNAFESEVKRRREKFEAEMEWQAKVAAATKANVAKMHLEEKMMKARDAKGTMLEDIAKSVGIDVKAMRNEAKAAKEEEAKPAF